MEPKTEIRRTAEPLSVVTKTLLGLLALVPISILLAVVHANPPLIFAVSALSLIPLAGFLGRATEEVALYTGPRLGGLLNATFGNAAELIVTIVALRAGLTTTVKATLAGSILGNVLFVLGASILLGGLKFGTQTFDRTDAGAACTMLALAVVSLLIPSFFHHGPSGLSASRLEGLSIAVAGILFVIYILYLIFSFRHGPGGAGESLEEDTPNWSRTFAIVVLFGTTLAVVVMSELLVHALEPTVHACERHPGHVDHLTYGELEEVLRRGRDDALDVEGETYELDMTDFDAIDYDGLITAIRAALASQRQ
ncbi:MAG: calcium:proton antiporter [Thermomicrobiales bacterium]